MEKKYSSYNTALKMVDEFLKNEWPKLKEYSQTLNSDEESITEEFISSFETPLGKTFAKLMRKSFSTIDFYSESYHRNELALRVTNADEFALPFFELKKEYSAYLNAFSFKLEQEIGFYIIDISAN